MPPSPGPGKIHSLPVKVLYSIDTSPHSYVTVLSSLQDVYVHFDAPKKGQLPRGYVPEGPMGSCLLKPVVRGVCYASPECIPNKTLDFSVYNLNPMPQAPAPRAFPGSADHSAWSGRGFLSWALAEASSGSTLVKGRLVREYEFSSTHFAPEGGLEGLVAAAAAAGGRGGRGVGEDDGKGWGLEVGISLRQLNPEGKAEFKGRSEFEETLSRGAVGGPTAGGSGSGAGGGAGESPAVGQMSSPAVSQQGFGQKQGQLHLPPPPVPQGNGMSRTGSAMSQGNGSNGMRPQPMRQQSMASSRLRSGMDVDPQGSGSSLPPSSYPGHSSSSSSNPPSRPSSTVPQAPRQPLQQYRSEPSQPSSGPAGPPSDSAGPAPSPAAVSAPGSPPPVPARNRQVTPPPPGRARSPPPSTPSRKKLHALLRADGMMSPELARHLASNPVLRNLLKAVPSNSHALSTLRNITGINPGEKKVKDEREEREEKEGSVELTTPTPSAGVVKPPGTGSGKQGVNQQAGRDVGAGAGCCNCGTTVSSCWRVRKMKEGPPRKVCDDCGIYFNEHKRMRPPELWDTNKTPTAGPSTTQNHLPSAQATPTEQKRRTQPEVFDGPAAGLRSSPRLNRSSSSHSVPQPPPHFAHGSGSGTSHMLDSPRKRSRVNKGVPPSPRMATRASARAGETHHGSDFGGEVFGFSPHSFGTPSESGSLHGVGNVVASGSGSGSGSRGGQEMNGGQTHVHGHPNGHAGGSGATHAGPPTADTHVTDADFDISALLQSMDESGDNFDINSLFAGGAEGAGTGTPELNQEILDLLAGWEGQLVNAEMDGAGAVGGVEGGGRGGG